MTSQNRCVWNKRTHKNRLKIDRVAVEMLHYDAFRSSERSVEMDVPRDRLSLTDLCFDRKCDHILDS